MAQAQNIDDAVDQLLAKRDEEQREQREEAEAQRRAEERNQLRDGITEFRRLTAELELAKLERQRCDSGLEAAESNPLIRRWLQAQWVANAAGCGYAFQTYAMWVVSKRSRSNRNGNEVSYHTWPSEIIFDGDDERDVIRAWIAAKANAQVAYSRECDLRYRLEHVLQLIPELADAH